MRQIIDNAGIPLSLRVRFAPRVDIRPMPAFMGTRPKGTNSISLDVERIVYSTSRVRFRANRTSSQHRRMTESDPSTTSAAQDSRSAKALFVLR